MVRFGQQLVSRRILFFNMTISHKDKDFLIMKSDGMIEIDARYL